MQKHTIVDIARETGYSIATVSRVLNNKGSFSAKSAKAILDAAKRLNYYMEPAEDPRRRLIAVVAPNLTNSFHYELQSGMNDCATENGYAIVMLQTNSNLSYAEGFREFFSSDMIDGIVMMEIKPKIKQLLKWVPSHIPVVQCNEYDDQLPHPYVSVKDRKSATNAVTYLYNTGHHNIGLINSTTASTYGAEREMGYRDALKACGIPVRKELIHHLQSLDFNIAYSTCLKILNEEERPDALFCVSDMYAWAAIRAAQELGIRVPEDLAVVGFDNVDLASMCNPPLTTVSQPRYEVGYMACHMLMRLIKNSSSTLGSTLLDTELIIRGSA